MAAAKLNFYIEQGVTFKRVLTVKDSLNAPIDLTGRTFKGEIRKSVGSARLLGSFDFTILDQVTNTGEVEMVLTAADSTAIPLEKQTDPQRSTELFAYDVEMTLVGGDVVRILEGTVELSPEITK